MVRESLYCFYFSSPLLYIFFVCSLCFIFTLTCSIVLFGLMTTRLNKYYYYYYYYCVLRLTEPPIFSGTINEYQKWAV